MNIKTKDIILTGLIALAGAVVLFILYSAYSQESKIVGNIFTDTDAYSGVQPITYTSSTLSGGVATLLVPRATSSRTYALVSQLNGTSTVFIYKQTTSTGVVVDQGTPLFTSSTPSGSPFFRVDKNDPYTGEIWGVSNGTTTKVLIEYHQN